LPRISLIGKSGNGTANVIPGILMHQDMPAFGAFMDQNTLTKPGFADLFAQVIHSPSVMKSTLNLVSVAALILGLVLAFPQDLSAKGKKSSKRSEPVVHDTVIIVNDNSITVSGKKETRTYGVSRFTSIMVNGKTASLRQIELGMSVIVGADSNGIASMINAYAAPKPAGKK
jgi:hypothetical protein